MRISDLRDFINKIPKEMDDFQIMFRRFEDEGDTLLYLDYPLTAMYIDEENKESVFLDEDNWLEPNHVESLVNIVQQSNTWAFSLRKIVDFEGNYICNDDCESLGKWESVINDYFVDVNCFFLPRDLALQFSPGWYRRARHPQEQPEVDRLLSMWLRGNKFTCNTSGEYTVNYRAGNRADSVQKEFFLKGNELMKQKYNGDLPWRKKTS
jgi:hypothetical protein